MYERALDILVRRFGGERLRHQALYQRLRRLPTVRDRVSLRAVVEEIDHIIQQTQDLERTVDEVAIMTIPQEKLTSKIVFELLRLELDRSDVWNTDVMLHELYCILEAREKADYYSSSDFRKLSFRPTRP